MTDDPSLPVRSKADIAAFIPAVRTLCASDTQARVDLRDGLGRPRRHWRRMHRHLVSFLDNDLKSYIRSPLYIVASLIATHPDLVAVTPTDDHGGPSLGTSLGELAFHPDGLAKGSAQRQLDWFSYRDLDLINRQLPPVIAHIARTGVLFSWERLTRDLTDWTYRRDDVLNNWYFDFAITVKKHDPTALDESTTNRIHRERQHKHRCFETHPHRRAYAASVPGVTSEP
ncbi:type I-E CRISPR-associated protein Cse2/CasB [Haloglycomyces albus]|uniref:type I-E CRISPR-associated protein Cse2/CasB n=1 Tax=Haloglycomyces albus TaxID=526067 RepID=UPI00046D2E11|nr:type I-E CRISPR-associated protein Cse2/CasB [Haloglycomyces albus]